MLAFFRNALSSWFVLGFLGIIMIAMLVTGVGTPTSMGSLVGSSSALASVGKSSVDAKEFERRLTRMLEEAQQKQPGITMAQMVSLGAADQLLDQMINEAALVEYAKKAGLGVSDAMIDKDIASNTMFDGVNGKFSQERYNGFLDQQKISDDAYRDSVRRSLLLQQVMAGVDQPATVPNDIVLPLASMGLEKRGGLVINFPAAVYVAGAAPTDAEILAFYNANKARYSVQETRSIKYAIIDRARFEGKVTPAEQDIQAYYRNNAEKFAAKEARALTQVIAQDQATANKIAEAGKSGASLSDAAKVSGLDALKIEPIEQKAFAGQSADNVAQAAFGGAQGSVLPPVKSGLGWHIIKIDQIVKTAGKTIDQARPEILPEVTRIKIDETMQDFIDQLDEAADEGKSIDDIAKSKGLELVATPDLTAGGIAPSQPDFKTDAALAPVLKAGFSSELDDPASSEQIGKNIFAYFDLANIKPSAPRPLAEIKAQVAEDFKVDRAAKLARKAADALIAKANSGAPIAEALKVAGSPAPSSVPVGATRMEIAAAGEQAPPPLKALFSMALNKARLIAMPEGKGWFVVYLNAIQPGDAKSDPKTVLEAQTALNQAYANEYGAQFLQSVRNFVGVTRNEEVISALKSRLSRGQTNQ